VYQEAADALAQRVQRETSDTPAPEARIARAFELVISRAPSVTETKRLRQLYDESLAAATSLAAAKPQEKLAPETRALSDVASAIINLDAAFVR
jgi:hypothetical protein